MISTSRPGAYSSAWTQARATARLMIGLAPSLSMMR